MTKILAGRLFAGNFLPVRVPLREVPADGTLREQIEAAIHQATGERLSWPELVRTAGGALPVIMLDGLDELLQATGVHRSDYLRQIVEFQQGETDLGRSAAVLVTTRTAVADRMRFPEGCLAVRLEPFDDEQVAQWLEVWNRANQAYFAECGRRPFSPEAALRHPGLAAQPLLLLMLALYDAAANALQHGDEGLSHADLYERLLLLFAEREVRKHVPGLDEERLSQEIEIELYRLAVAAFGMFSRGRQRISAAELNDDLANLTVTPAAQTSSFQSPLSGADRVIGRFFFVHRSDAVQDGVTLQTYEFLHATFGEYLVARLLRDELGRVVGRWTAASAGPYFARPGIEDGLLYALLSFALLTERTAILDFLAELISSLDTAQVKDLLIRLLQGAESRTDQSYSGYLSGQSTFITRHAYYTANLVILAALAGGGVLGSELFPGGGHPRIPWRSLTALWESRISGDALAGLTDKVQADRIWNDGNAPDLRIHLTDAAAPTRVGGFDFAWLSTHQDRQWHLGERSLRVAHFLCGPTTDALAHAAEPAIDTFEESFDAWSYLTGTDRSRLSPGRIMLEILMDRYTAQEDPTGLYERAFRMLGPANDLIPMATRLRCLSAVLDLIDTDVAGADRTRPVPEWTPVLANSLRELHDDLAEDGHDAHARTAVEKAVSLYRRVNGADPAACRPELAEALLALSREYVDQGEQRSALRTVEEAVILHQTLAAGDATALPRLAEALHALATRHLAVKNRAEAVRAAREAVAVARGLTRADPVTRQRVLAICLKTLAEALNHQEEAIAAEQESVDLYRGLAADDADGWRPSLKDALDNLSYSLSYRGELQGALAASQESLSIVRALEQQDTDRWRRDLIWSLDNVAFDLSRLGLHEEAEVASQEAIARCRKDPDIPTNRLGDCVATLAEIRYLAGQPERALPAAEESVALHRALYDAQPAQWRTQLARALNALCNVLVGLRDLDRAMAAAGESIDLLRAENGDHSGRNLTQALLSLMETLVVQGRHEEASAVAEEALACCEDLRTRTEAIVSWWEVDALITAGRLVATEGRPRDAVRLLVKAIEYAEDRETLVIAACDALRPAWLRRPEPVEAAYREATGGGLPDRVTAGGPPADH
ncbi:hypothetical protein E1286_18200 [Nonomuraea terrae]|uniref:Tetratricopeptide repeat protein n=1 Tax=Nonomuraea terrae TaxID=2530383 RepID=A0A4R4YUB1_9ACTN|nr:tetratricopeptide repeat protein [Nonomuraea terrae]TDD47212.1 hypothetical protein E1286_18200 [Nonomuraea terrae]